MPSQSAFSSSFTPVKSDNSKNESLIQAGSNAHNSMQYVVVADSTDNQLSSNWDILHVSTVYTRNTIWRPPDLILLASSIHQKDTSACHSSFNLSNKLRMFMIYPCLTYAIAEWKKKISLAEGRCLWIDIFSRACNFNEDIWSDFTSSILSTFAFRT